MNRTLGWVALIGMVTATGVSAWAHSEHEGHDEAAESASAARSWNATAST